MSVELLCEVRVVADNDTKNIDSVCCPGVPPDPAGPRNTTGQLFSDLYEELKTIARNRMLIEPPGHTLQPAALVNECYLRMSKTRKTWINRQQFFCMASEMMRRILVDIARSKKRLKRGGNYRRQPLDENSLKCKSNSELILDLSAALEKLEATEPKKAELVKLRFFGGLTCRQAAYELGIGLSTAELYWSYTRAWLKNELTEIGSTN